MQVAVAKEIARVVVREEVLAGSERHRRHLGVELEQFEVERRRRLLDPGELERRYGVEPLRGPLARKGAVQVHGPLRLRIERGRGALEALCVGSHIACRLDLHAAVAGADRAAHFVGQDVVGAKVAAGGIHGNGRSCAHRAVVVGERGP